MVDRFGLREFINRQNISTDESGELEPPLPALLLYAEAAGICTDVLIDDTKNPPRKLTATPRHKP
jgi:hypothetical protein